MLRSRLGLVKRCVTVQSGESLVPISVQQQPHHVLTKAPPLGHIGKERVKESSILLQRPWGGWGRFTFAHGSTSAPFYPYSVRLQQSNVKDQRALPWTVGRLHRDLPGAVCTDGDRGSGCSAFGGPCHRLARRLEGALDGVAFHGAGIDQMVVRSFVGDVFREGESLAGELQIVQLCFFAVLADAHAGELVPFPLQLQ